MFSECEAVFTQEITTAI